MHKHLYLQRNESDAPDLQMYIVNFDRFTDIYYRLTIQSL